MRRFKDLANERDLLLIGTKLVWMGLGSRCNQVQDFNLTLQMLQFGHDLLVNAASIGFFYLLSKWHICVQELYGFIHSLIFARISWSRNMWYSSSPTFMAFPPYVGISTRSPSFTCGGICLPCWEQQERKKRFSMLTDLCYTGDHLLNKTSYFV